MNGLVTLAGGQPTTTTLIMADGAGLDHASVIKLVRTYLSDLEEFGGVGFEIEPFQTAGGMQNREVARLNEQQATLLLTYMRNSDIVREFKKGLVKAFWEMSRQLYQPVAFQLPDFTNPAAAARAWADVVEQKQAVEVQVQQVSQQLALVAPKAQALDRIANSDGSLCITDAAKTLQVQPRALTQVLVTKAWIYRRPMGAGWLAYQDRIQSGHLEHKVTTGDRADGTEWTNTQVRVTAKGLAKLAEILASPPAQLAA